MTIHGLPFIYLVASTLMLGWVGACWSTKTGFNLFLKSVFVGVALLGAVLVAKQSNLA